MPDIGSTLRETRMRKRIDITEVESATKIRAKYLRALENEEWDLLPGPTFVRTFLRTYGDYLGLDSKLLVEEYKQRFERPAPQDLLPFSPRSSSRRQRRPPAIPPFAVVALCVVALLAALYALGQLGEDTEEPQTAASPTPTATATPAADDSGRERRRRPAQPTRVKLRIIPEAVVNVCLVSGTSGRVLIPSENLDSPTRTFTARRLRVTFGNGLVRMRIGKRTFEVPDTDEPIGYELRPGKRPRVLGADVRPTCVS